jgi:hypothetical protein
MQKLSRILFYLGSASACFMMMFTTGCASGGYTLTRKYSQFVNSQNIILRIVLYILTGIIFAVTILVDLVVNNTIDFWEGRVSANTYEFQKDGKSFYVQHEVMPKSDLKRSTIKVMDGNHKLLQTIILAETPKHEIELSVDGVLRTKVQNIYSLPKLSSFDKNGKLLEQKDLSFLESNVAVN